MATRVKIMSICCDDGEVEIWRAEHMPTKKIQTCTVCGAKITGVHFAYMFGYAGELLATLVVRACCDEHMESLEEALCRTEERLTPCPKGIDAMKVWEDINTNFAEQGMMMHIGILP